MRRAGEPAAPPGSLCTLVVVGIEFEARGLERRLGRLRDGVRAPGAPLIMETVGPRAAQLARLDRWLATGRVGAVVAAGVAGGCAPDVAPGDLVVGCLVGSGAGGVWRAADPALLERAARAAATARLPHRTGRLLTVDDVVTTPAAKVECWRRHAALAVDMESAHILAWASRVGLPALAVRAVADGPADALPTALLRAVGPAGRVRPGALVGWIGRPALWAAAWQAWRRSRTALDRLARFLATFATIPPEP